MFILPDIFIHTLMVPFTFLFPFAFALFALLEFLHSIRLLLHYSRSFACMLSLQRLS